jgi:energy-coupling factor transporter ATP-binding protein EcfA2
MFPLNFFLNKFKSGFLSDEISEYLKIAPGVDKFKYEIQASEYYYKILNLSISNFEKNVFNIEDSYGESSYCFYCGQKAEVIIPAYMHNGSGINLWMYKDWRFTTLLCSSCDKHAGKRKVSYKKKFSEISPNHPKQILKLEPDILLPSLEPAFKHFKYLKNGTLEPLTIRGKSTIKCFSLNRQDLVERRMDYMIQYEREKEFNQNMTSLDVLFCIAQEKDFDLDNDEYMEHLAKFLHKKSNLYADRNEIHNLLKIEFPTTTYKQISENRIRTRYYYPNFSGLKNIKLTGIRGFEENQILNFDGRKSLILIGENGVGKSTLLELIKRIINPHTKLTLTDLINMGSDDAKIEVEYNDFSHITSFTENDVHKICKSLVKHNGSSKAVLDELSTEIPLLNYHRIDHVKQKKAWSYISDEYFDIDAFTPRHLFTDDEVHEICKALVDNNGSNVRTVEQLKNKYPTLSINYLQKLKVKD